MLNATVQGCNYFFGNVYAPNKVREQCAFFKELEKKMDDFIADENHRIIIGGDFNVVNDPDLDCSGGTPKEKESIKFLNSICLSYTFGEPGTRTASCLPGNKRTLLSKGDLIFG